MTDQQIAPGAGPTPVAITVQGSEQLMPKLAYAEYDGTGAAGDFVPVLQFIGPGGQLAGQAVGDVVTAGASVAQSWFRGLERKSGGGAALTVAAEYARSGGTVVAPGTGAGNNFVPWAHGSGAALLDYTTNTAPTVIAAGYYALTINAILSTAVFNKPSVMAAFFQAGPTAFLKGVCPLATNVFGGLGGVDTPEVVLTMPPIHLAAGDVLSVDIRQGSGGNLSFSLQSPVGAIVSRLS